MIFLSAQPDTLYFKWQLEVQLVNFRKHGITKEQIHVLIGYDPEKGLLPKFAELLVTFKDNALFFLYEDTRTNRLYSSSLRPHIIKKHFQAYPEIGGTPVFYHDPDIIFRELPDFASMCSAGDATWYVSDTRSYISAEWLISTGRVVLQEMCMAIDMDQELVELNSNHSGGAQYLMKGVNYQFWDRVESDCVKMYRHLSMHNERYAQLYEEQTGQRDYQPPLAWCADMWAVLWNAFRLQYPVRIHDDLAFCWPKEDMVCWEQTKIFHNAGLGREHAHMHFYKGDFEQLAPYHVNFDYVKKEKCSWQYVLAVRETEAAMRADLSDVTFLLPVRIDSSDRQDNLKMAIQFLRKYFRTHIIVLEADVAPRVDKSVLTENTGYLFVEDSSHWFHRTKYNNEMIRMATTPYIALWDVDVVAAPSLMVDAVNQLRNSDCKVCLPFDGKVAFVADPALKKLFQEQLDIKILQKVKPSQFKSVGGAVFLDREVFIACGMENERFFKWGPEDQERLRRMAILGYKAVRIKGTLYHIDHVTFHNSGYNSTDDYQDLMQLQLQVVNAETAELKEQVKDWNQFFK
ncbi:galactosyltransferase-related protein [Chitinophaga sp.]|uniref:galactosyltransferase-related protein n=1 Tax=Chitinophaga sp. TaxID=1869181 RepID=UPI0031DC623C